MKRVLVIGGGGREHAILQKIHQDSKEKEVELFCASGNAGISKIAKCVDISPKDIEKLKEFSLKEKIDLVIVGMDDPLVMGITDEFQKIGIRIFGPDKKSAIIEGSKVFSKNFMEKYNIPTAKYRVFENPTEAQRELENEKYPLVIKADGLALGKGVIICETYIEAKNAISEIMLDKKFGDSGNKIVVEEFLIGEEVSILSFCDGNTVVPMISSKDHKKAKDGDKGLNTGGMGAISPCKSYTKEIAEICMEKIFRPTIEGLNAEGRTFKGIVFFGLILCKDGPKVIEYNCRFGDPETQAILPLLKTDLLSIVEACIDGNLENINIEWEEKHSVCVVLASGGYPESYKTGYDIEGLEQDTDDLYIFHAGTKFENTRVVTNGGRVLGVTGIGKTYSKARDITYSSIDKIMFKDMYFRKDIGMI